LLDGDTIEPSVSVPIAAALKLAATDAPDPELDHRLSGIERTLSEIASRLEQPDTSATKVAEDMKRLAQRIDATEVSQRDSVLELREQLANAAAQAPRVEVPPSIDSRPSVPPPPPDAALEAPPFTEEPVHEDFATHAESTDAFAPALDIASLPMHDAAAEAPVADVDALQPETHTEPLASDAMAPPAAESYLSAARRSARAAAAQTESELGSRVGGFSWGASASVSSDEAKPDPRKTYVVVGIIALVLILAIAAGAFLSQRISSTSPRAAAPLFRAQRPVAALPAHAPAAAPVLNTVVVPATGQAAPASPTIDTHAVPPAATQGATGARVATIAPLDKLTTLANSGNANAELIVGLKYLDGDGVAVNEADAAKWLNRAAVAGLPVAQYRLGTLFERGRGVAADPVKSVHWYTLAAQAGNRKAMHNLAVAYASGTGVSKNMSEAARWFSKAAALGLSDSQFNLAVLYERGLGVPQSLLDAYKWYAIAATSGDTESKARIDALATQLSADDRAAALRSVATFRAQPLDPKANVAPQLSDIAN
jgi:localization factor PodJL